MSFKVNAEIVYIAHNKNILLIENAKLTRQKAFTNKVLAL